MLDILAFIFILVQVVTAQVIPYGANTAGTANVAGIYQLNTISGLPISNGATNNYNAAITSNAINERIATENAANARANDASNLINLAGNKISSVNGNVATFDLGGDGRSFTITSGSPGPQGFGFQVQADALEVGGTVSVNGQIPIYGTVSVSGNVPTDGTAAVNYSCGKAGATDTE
ncbi:uncharacterized protein LOC121739894 [Aricia agestis]|uniref:uncharacterized protein LOC121739894 n=1 Tax=Aricia agestis TaxID=91739 RepID=UPI001C20224B|nr:uncharacterized protein LOC121739894 [Aricia agestis]